MTTIQKIVKNSPTVFEYFWLRIFKALKLLEYVWKESMRVLTKMYAEELRPLSTLDNDSLNEIVTDSTFKKHKKNSIIDFSMGGVFLRGL